MKDRQLLVGIEPHGQVANSVALHVWQRIWRFRVTAKPHLQAIAIPTPVGFNGWIMMVEHRCIVNEVGSDVKRLRIKHRRNSHSEARLKCFVKGASDGATQIPIAQVAINDHPLWCRHDENAVVTDLLRDAT